MRLFGRLFGFHKVKNALIKWFIAVANEGPPPRSCTTVFIACCIQCARKRILSNAIDLLSYIRMYVHIKSFARPTISASINIVIPHFLIKIFIILYPKTEIIHLTLFANH